MLTKIISGGQTGADQGGLTAGTALGLTTGGFAPKGWLTELGPAPWLADFGLKESRIPGYPARTEMNVKYSCATLIVGGIDEPGSKLTMAICHRLRKPNLHLDYPWNFHSRRDYFLKWLGREKVQILNVAGNRESRNPGIQEAVMEFLIEALESR